MFVNEKNSPIVRKNECTRCDYYFLCLGGCQGISFYNNEQANQELCNYTRKLYDASFFGM